MARQLLPNEFMEENVHSQYYGSSSTGPESGFLKTFNTILSLFEGPT